MLLKIWEWFNGNKMAIGTLMIALNTSGLYSDLSAVYIVFSYLGPLLAGGGLLHKVVKGVDNT